MQAIRNMLQVHDARVSKKLFLKKNEKIKKHCFEQPIVSPPKFLPRQACMNGTIQNYKTKPHACRTHVTIAGKKNLEKKPWCFFLKIFWGGFPLQPVPRN